jgi:hypothetical protein
MIQLLQYYFVFAAATSITSCYFFFWPLLKQAKLDGIENSLTNGYVMSALVYIVVGMVLAPVLFLILCIPQVAQNYTNGLDSIIREEKN